MPNIVLPKEINLHQISPNRAEIIITPCYPGYGTTLGNALRRVLLSSLEGAAATAVKIKGVSHEFSSIPYVKEDVVEIILNLKNLRFKSESDEPQELVMQVKGEKKVTGASFEKNSQVKIANPNQLIATLTDKAAELDLKLKVEKGHGYVPVEARPKEKLDIGYIAIDAIYTPIRNVNFRIEHVRVEQMTNYDKLILDITTDGTKSPAETLKEATSILVEHFQFIQKTTPKKVK